MNQIWRWELISIRLTAAAAQDPLLHDVPDGFWAVSGHKERAIELPETAILLAYTDRCPYHAFRMAGKPFYGFQFHPEIDPIDLVARITRYQQRYLDSEAALGKHSQQSSGHRRSQTS